MVLASIVTIFKEGDKVRYKKFPDGSGFYGWNGLEGTVVRSNEYDTRVTVTKAPNNLSTYGRVGTDMTLTTTNLELVLVPDVTVTPAVGDKIRIKKTEDTADKWVGIEGVIDSLPTRGDFYQIKLTTTSKDIYYGVGEIISLPGRKFDVIEQAPRGIQAGDKVRFTSGAWEGTVAEFIDMSGYNYKASVKILEPSQGCWLRAGAKGSTDLARLELIPALEEFPREVEISEIRVGDTIRVTYPKQSGGRTVEGDVREESTIVRTARVEKVNGGELVAGSGHLINARINGLSQAVYELLERPEAPEVPEANPMTEAAVGASFLTSHGMAGKRLLTKISEDKWTDFFLDGQIMYTATDSVALTLFNDRGGKWVKR